MPVTDDPSDPRLTRGVDSGPADQADAYLVLSDEERRKGFVRPLRCSYRHEKCGVVTTMAYAIAETYARRPDFYGATFCIKCRMHLPVVEFTWYPDGSTVGS